MPLCNYNLDNLFISIYSMSLNFILCAEIQMPKMYALIIPFTKHTVYIKEITFTIECIYVANMNPEARGWVASMY